MDQTDTVINNIKEQAVVLIGLARSGKSAAFNWIMNKPMKSFDYYGEVLYKELTEDSAVVSDGYSLVTLVPNYGHTDTETIIDLPGFSNYKSY